MPIVLPDSAGYPCTLTYNPGSKDSQGNSIDILTEYISAHDFKIVLKRGAKFGLPELKVNVYTSVYGITNILAYLEKQLESVAKK